MELTRELRDMYIQTAEVLRGSERRIFMAQVTQMLGDGGQRMAESQLGWNRGTIRKGLRELKHGKIEDNYGARGRKSAETHLPNLLTDITTLMNERKSSAALIRDRLIREKGYSHDKLPSAETIRKKINKLRAEGQIA